ncbi:hypothetical protein ACLOJK_002529 [Asimina triloba]
MAGMLPGVECARRRRIHQGSSNDPQSGTRRSSFCLYTTSHESHLNSNPNSMLMYMFAKINQLIRSSATQSSSQNEKLGDVAREAKERLDERLKPQKKSQLLTRHHSLQILRPKDEEGHGSSTPSVFCYLLREVFDPKKKSCKKLIRWARLGWKASDRGECAVCLDRLKAEEVLAHLPCGHRFHSMCLIPWLESNPHCPCCRIQIFS